MITEPILRFKKGITVNDLIDLSGFKDLQDVIINNNFAILYNIDSGAGMSKEGK